MTIDSDTLAFANRLADAAGEVIRPYFRTRIPVIDKGGKGTRPIFDPVTEADRAAEDAMRALIKAGRPQDGILGEERGHEPGTSGRTWILDPIDGTRPFITGRHTWGTLIALVQGETPVLGIIDQPVLGERFIGHDGASTLVTAAGRERMRTRACAALATAVVSTTHPWGYFSRRQRAAFESVCEAAQMSYFGGDCYGYALLAMGFIDVVIEGRLAPWDVAALIPVIEGAGGAVTDWMGQPFANGACVLAVGDRRLLPETVELLKGA
ncbi:MAG TPA: histidinol-phosphatase [Rhizomicrobium sp.]|nr:histidinol-phosphatase [Rhizomicrobium sp.]